ncbi:hypothetical protein BJX66DRAFT_345501 [Aspergillus keveii]|uniref:Uncharacterized protein n=1 Tax=Aspergillus keveii TaxID=714993 RepID=A0ABR4FI94_9EURO
MFPNWLRMYYSPHPYLSVISPPVPSNPRTQRRLGVALSYILLNLIAATEKFALNFGYIALTMPSSGVFVHKSLTVGDWLNLAQTTLVWVFFALCLSSPSESTFRHRKIILGIYLAYFITIIPLFIAAVIMGSDDKKGAWDELPALFAFIPHMLWLNYIGTIFAVVATYLQARAILRPRSRPDPLESEVPAESEPELESAQQVQEQGQEESSPSQKHTPTSLSVLGLAIQSVLFMLLAVSWIFRVSFPPLPEGATWWDYRVLKVWYEMMGSVAVDKARLGLGRGYCF